MTVHEGEPIQPPNVASHARSFSRLGWAGFWLQVVFGSLPIIGLGFYLTFLFEIQFAAPGRVSLRQILDDRQFANPGIHHPLVVPLHAARQANDGSGPATDQRAGNRDSVDRRRSKRRPACCLSMFIMVIEAANMLFYFLKSPQAGMPVIQTGGADAVHWISAVDMVSLFALILMVFAEALVLVFGIWLLRKSTAAGPESPPASAHSRPADAVIAGRVDRPSTSHTRNSADAADLQLPPAERLGQPFVRRRADQRA